MIATLEKKKILFIIFTTIFVVVVGLLGLYRDCYFDLDSGAETMVYEIFGIRVFSENRNNIYSELVRRYKLSEGKSRIYRIYRNNLGLRKILFWPMGGETSANVSIAKEIAFGVNYLKIDDERGEGIIKKTRAALLTGNKEELYKISDDLSSELLYKSSK